MGAHVWESKFCIARRKVGEHFMAYDALGNINVLLSPWTESLHTFFIKIDCQIIRQYSVNQHHHTFSPVVYSIS